MNSSSLRITLTLFLLLSGTIAAYAQADTSGMFRDTSSVFHPVPVDSGLNQSRALTAYHPSKNPWVAVGLSAALPGAGQIYNQTYWKIPIIWGLGGFWIHEWIQQNNKYQDYRQLYRASITPETPKGNGTYLELRDFYRDQRDSFAWYLGALYFLNLVDAYVGANLYDFNVTPDLGADGRVSPKVTATLRAHF